MQHNALRHQIELALYLLFVLMIPLFEAPKNILFGLFTLTWLANRFLDKDIGGRWCYFDSVILIWWVANILVNLVSLYHGHGFSGAMDLIVYTSVLWMLSRTRLSEKQMIWIMAVFTIGSLITLAWAYWKLEIAHTKQHLEYNSVGQTNHTAIYIDLSFALVTGFVLAFWKKAKWAWIALGIISAALLVQGMFFTNSRAAAIAMAGLFLFLGIFWLKRNIKLSALLFACLVIGLAGSFALQIGIVKKQEAWHQMVDHREVSPRVAIWHTAWIGFEHHPIFGLGSHNYKLLSPEMVKKWSIEKTGSYDPDYYGFAPHAHNLYMNTLAEMGIVGFVGLMLFLISWLVILVRSYPKKDDPDIAWAVWAASFSAFFINVLIGFMNTTLHHEHALLSMNMLGMALCYYYGRLRHDENTDRS